MKLDVIKDVNGTGFGERLKDFRKQRGLSQRQVASAINMTAAAVCNWEQGKSRPRAAVLPRLSAILHVSIDQLLGKGSPDDSSKTALADAVIYRARQDIADALSVDFEQVRVFVAERDTGWKADEGKQAHERLSVGWLLGAFLNPFFRK
jgi:transcriptional regulator with XRE-family HTH domain